MLQKLSTEHESLLLSSSVASSSLSALHQASFRDSGNMENSAHSAHSTHANASGSENAHQSSIHRNHVNPLSNLRFKYVVDRSNSTHAKTNNSRWDPYDGDSYMSIYPTFRLQFPEHIIITKRNIQMYVGVHRLLFFANIVSHSLRTSWLTFKIADRKRKGVRWLHVLRHRVHHVVRAMQEQAATSLHQAWSTFYQCVVAGGLEEEKEQQTTNGNPTQTNDALKNIIELRTLHSMYVEEMATSCFVMDSELRQTSFDILNICLRCARVLTLAARSNLDEQFVVLKQKAMGLNEDLSMLLKKFVNIMSRPGHQMHFAALVLTLNSLL